MLQRGPFLLVTGDDALAASLGDLIGCYGPVRRVRSPGEASSALGSAERPPAPASTSPLAQSWCGIVLDMDGLDADPAQAVRALRESDPLVPLLALASKAAVELVNALHLHRAQLVLKPFGEDNIVSFVQRALASGWLPDERVTTWIDELARRHNLTPGEIELVAYAIGNEPRLKAQRRLGINETVLKTQVRSLLRKCSARSMDSLAKVVLRDALVFGIGPQMDEEEVFEESTEIELNA